MNIFFTGDLHLGHKNILRYRKGPWETLEEYHESIKEEYHKVVRPRDIVYFLGDVAFTHEMLEELGKWNGVKRLILGNHDNDKVSTADIIKSGTYEKVYGFFKFKEFWLSHCPIHPAELRGRANIHGHTHPVKMSTPHYFNVCLDTRDNRPVSLENIRNSDQYKELGHLVGR